jgi:hypothetical protein
VVSTGGEAHAAHGHLQCALAGIVQHAQLAHGRWPKSRESRPRGFAAPLPPEKMARGNGAGPIPNGEFKILTRKFT